MVEVVVSVDEFLAILDQSKGTIFLSLATITKKLPGEGGLNKFKRGTRGKDAIPCPFQKGIYHYLKQQVILGASYEGMVNRQRERELDAYKASLPTPPKFVQHNEPTAEYFIAEQLWRGKGQRDATYPRFCAIHTETLTRYLCFRPHSTDESGQPTPLTSEYFCVETARTLDFDTDLADYHQPIHYGSKVQQTDKAIPWQTVKLENIVGATHKGIYYMIEG